jgi:hypothetical protein
MPNRKTSLTDSPLRFLLPLREKALSYLLSLWERIEVRVFAVVLALTLPSPRGRG